MASHRTQWLLQQRKGGEKAQGKKQRGEEHVDNFIIQISAVYPFACLFIVESGMEIFKMSVTFL